MAERLGRKLLLVEARCVFVAAVGGTVEVQPPSRLAQGDRGSVVVVRAGFKAYARTAVDGWRANVDHAVHRVGTIDYASRPLDHLYATGML